MDGLICARYANALIKQAESLDIIEEVKNDAKFLISLYNENNDFRFLLKIPSVGSKEKSRMLESALGKSVHDLTMDFIKLVVTHKRESLLAPICESYIKKYQEKHGIKDVLLTTAVPMDEEVYSEIRQAVETGMGIKAEMKTKIDPDIIGGFILNIDNHLQMDASVVWHLEKIKKTILEK
jgi:ATP synthase, F1 delta subunit